MFKQVSLYTSLLVLLGTMLFSPANKAVQDSVSNQKATQNVDMAIDTSACSRLADYLDPKAEKSTKLRVAVASNFYYPLLQLLKHSNAWSTDNITIIKGSTGTLFAQINKGAPFDVFLSADTVRPKQLMEKGLASCKETYAFGNLVLWPAVVQDLSKTQGQDVRTSIDAFITYLSKNKSPKFAIANPKLAPYGQAAVSVLTEINALEPLKEHMVLGANVTQAFQFLDSGNAKLGLVSESVLIQAYAAFGKDRYKDYKVVPKALYTAIEQQALVTANSKHQQLAAEFVSFLSSSKSQQLLSTLGYTAIQAVNRS